MIKYKKKIIDNIHKYIHSAQDACLVLDHLYNTCSFRGNLALLLTSFLIIMYLPPSLPHPPPTTLFLEIPVPLWQLYIVIRINKIFYFNQ